MKIGQEYLKKLIVETLSEGEPWEDNPPMTGEELEAHFLSGIDAVIKHLDDIIVADREDIDGAYTEAAEEALEALKRIKTVQKRETY